VWRGLRWAVLHCLVLHEREGRVMPSFWVLGGLSGWFLGSGRAFGRRSSHGYRVVLAMVERESFTKVDAPRRSKAYAGRDERVASSRVPSTATRCSPDNSRCGSSTESSRNSRSVTSKPAGRDACPRFVSSIRPGTDLQHLRSLRAHLSQLIGADF
jgi:hypothetical protein